MRRAHFYKHMDNDDNEGRSDGAAWRIVDLFRDGPERWKLREATFSTTRTVGTDWTLVLSIKTDAETTESVVWICLDRIEPIERAIKGLAFLRSIERCLIQAGYSGHLSIQGIDRVSLSAFFDKPLPDAEAVRAEMVFLDRFDLREPT